jgi:hypothetical protein
MKTSALTLIAMAACMILLLTPDSFQSGVDVEIPAPSLRASIAQFKHSEIQQLAPSPGVLVNPRRATAAIEKSQLNQVDKVPLILYPELAEI